MDRHFGNREKNIDQGMLVLILVFTPLINACAGNTGSQMAGLMIRGLALGEMDVGAAVEWLPSRATA